MEPISDHTSLLYARKIGLTFLLSFVLFTITSIVIGEERKSRWFKKRTKYTFFTRRSIFGEFVHFGHPCTKEGVLVFVFLMSVIFSFGYWYIFA